MKLYKLVGPDGRQYESPNPGTLGGHKGHKGYGRLDCPSALAGIARGYYVRKRVFFVDERTAIAAGYRPCSVCMKERYLLGKQAQSRTSNKQEALALYQELILSEKQ